RPLGRRLSNRNCLALDCPEPRRAPLPFRRGVERRSRAGGLSGLPIPGPVPLRNEYVAYAPFFSRAVAALCERRRNWKILRAAVPLRAGFDRRYMTGKAG